ncbi:MAG: hypothetical protein IMZ60_01925 [Actinobacteria bacterium]|nr:hypothetical protein [Actinomycetota bacterium]
MKKKIILILVLVLLFLALLTNYSQGEEKIQVSYYLKGNDYLKMSEEIKSAYVMGLIDMLLNQTRFYDSEDYSNLNEATNDMNIGQIKAIFDKYLEEHPEIWHLVASSLFWTAIMEIVGEN